MAASDYISEEQFHTGKNGRQYLIGKNEQDLFGHSVVAVPAGNKRPVGHLSFFREGGLSAGTDPARPEVFKAFVKEAHRRNGLASAMFDYAEKNMAPGLQHSGALSPDGKAFKEGHLRKQRGDVS